MCEHLTREVFSGCYSHPELPTEHSTDYKTDGNIRLILDVGGGWGAFTVWALARWPVARVIAYEPHDKARDYFARNVAPELASKTVELVGAAVTTNPEPKINGCEDWGSYSLDTGECAWPVPGVHPRDLPPCDVFKCDAESAEVDIMEHYPHLSSCKALLIEWHNLENKERVREIAEAAGFRCLKEEPEPATYGISLWVKP